MAKFLETQAISNELMKLIKDAKDKIILVSPYLKVNSQIQERLKTKSKIGTLSEIVIIYGKSELKKSELEWIKEIEDLKVIEKNNLHAKCYINEEKAIVCSMNLHDYSQQNNIEMGILITKKDDEEAYHALIEEINNIKVNGIRKKFDSLNIVEDPSKIAQTTNNEENKKQVKGISIKQIELTPD
jgi:phosphatidylserine/phosphatidylglycerophosphate/cardiolipin synthase-like enzyme